MNKPIDKPEFWAKRLEDAKQQGDLRQSVFVASDEKWKEIDKVHWRIINRLISSSDKILDAGCGYGRISTWFSSYYYTGVDQSEEFIEEAKRNRDHSFYVESLCDLSFGTDYFDWAIGISLKAMVIRELGYQQWDDIQTELLRVTKKGIICLEYTDPDVYTIIKRMK